jgi:glycosyltransferase involved in cell wall biosynthesis
VWGSLFLIVRMAASKKKIRLVITHHMDIFGRPLIRIIARLLYDKLVSSADVVLVTSIKNADISSDLRVPCRIEAVPLGLNVDEFTVSHDVEVEALALKSGIKERSIVAFVGRHARYKGLDLLLRAVAELSDVHLILAGDGPCTQSLKELSKILLIDDRVTFVGRVSHQSKLAILKAADVFAFPSTEITEAFGISQLEAMAMETPVVASNLPTGVTDVAVDDVSAILVEPGSVAALREGLAKSLTDRELARRLASTAKHRVLTVFNNKLVSRLAARMVEAGPAANIRP